MNRLLACMLLLGSLWLAAATPAEAQRRYRGRRPPVPRRYYAPPAYRPGYGAGYGPGYYHAAPYRVYGGRRYYRPRPVRRPIYRRGPAVIIGP